MYSVEKMFVLDIRKQPWVTSNIEGFYSRLIISEHVTPRKVEVGKAFWVFVIDCHKLFHPVLLSSDRLYYIKLVTTLLA